MTRPLRIEFAGALYHTTSRGNARGDIYKDNIDRTHFLKLLSQLCDRHGWLCHSYCLMTNHYHLLIETIRPTLSKGMKGLNGQYAQMFNRRHKRVGHVFQGRHKAIIVQKENYLLELARYIVLNPVRAKMVQTPEQWPWSSYRALAGISTDPSGLTTEWILAMFSTNKKTACQRYRNFVADGNNQPAPWLALKNQIYLGSDEFVDDMLCKLDPLQPVSDIPSIQKLSAPKPLEYYKQKYKIYSIAMAVAYLSGHYTLTEVGNEFNVSRTTVSRAVTKYASDRAI